MTVTLPIQSMQALTSTEQSAMSDLSARLNAGQTLSGTVREVAADPGRANLFRVRVELQHQLMELISSRPLNTGTQINLSRGSDGGLQLTLNDSTQSRTPSTGDAATRPAVTATTSEGRATTLTLQIPDNRVQSALLARTLPLNQPQSGQVLTSQTSQSPAPSVQLSVNGQHIELISPRALQSGLAVTLTRTDQTRVQLQVQPPVLNPAAQTRLQEGLQQILRTALPQQLPMAEVLNQLNQLGSSSRQGDAIGQVVRSMLSLFSVPDSADTGTTRQAVQNQLQASGLLPAATPGAGSGQPAQAALQEPLTRLQQLAEQLPAEARERLQTLLQGLKARTAVNQTQSLQSWQDQPDGAIERQYRFDLPIRLADERLENAEIRIRQQRHQDAQEQPLSQWSIALHFDIEPLGAIDARISLQQEWQLSARFWAEQEQTAQQIRDRLPRFEQQLRHSGFQIEALHVQQGAAPPEPLPTQEQRLVDLHT